jgi:hypothetical protein
MWEEFGAAQTLRFRGPIFRLRLTVTFTRNHFDLFQISVMLFVRLFLVICRTSCGYEDCREHGLKELKL